MLERSLSKILKELLQDVKDPGKDFEDQLVFKPNNIKKE